MDLEYAKQLLTTLADGINPLTGEVLPAEDSCNQVEIVRAIHKVLFDLDRKEKPNKALPENAGKPWTPEDEATLCRMYDAGSSRKEICTFFKRSTGAIAARLVRLGKIEDRDEYRRK